MSFNSITGGLVDTIVAGAANNLSSQLTGTLTGRANFSVNSLLSSAVQNVSGYALNSGQNYLLSQVSSLVPTSLANGLANAVTTQVAAVGINEATSFLSQTLTRNLGPVFGAGIGGALNGALSEMSGGSGGLAAATSNLPNAEYGGNLYTLTEVVFSIVPSNVGPQTQIQPQSVARVPLNVAFSERALSALPSVEAMKKNLALNYAGKALTPSQLSAFTSPSVTKYEPRIQPFW